MAEVEIVSEMFCVEDSKINHRQQQSTSKKITHM